MMPPALETLPPAVQEVPFGTLYTLWRRACRPGLLPARRDFDPADLPPRHLSQILLFECLPGDGEARFRFRVAGTAFHNLIGYEATGRFVGDLAEEERTRPVLSALSTIVETRRPVYLASRPTAHSPDHAWARRLGLPLAADGTTVDMILAIFTTVAEIPIRHAADGAGNPLHEERYLL